MKKTKKIRLVAAIAIVLALIGYVTFICFHYFFYKGYEKYLTGYTFEPSAEFVAMNDNAPKVNGMVLAAENEFLKLYTNGKTTEIAVYDKRTDEITYSNPVDRADDPIASGRNMNNWTVKTVCKRGIFPFRINYQYFCVRIVQQDVYHFSFGRKALTTPRCSEDNTIRRFQGIPIEKDQIPGHSI